MSPEPVYDAETLRESYADPDEVEARLAELQTELLRPADDVEELVARGDRVDLLRVSGRLDDALEAGVEAVARAADIGSAPQQHMARLRLARVYQWRGEYDEASAVLAELVGAAERFGPVIAAFTHQGAGENEYEQGHYSVAAGHFTIALEVRERFELPDDQVAVSRVALAAARRHGGSAAEPGEST